MTLARAACVVVLSLFPFLVIAADAPLLISVTDAGINVTNATPGGDVVLFAAGLDGSRGVLRQRRVATPVAASDAGTVAYQPERRLPYRTICVAVDVETGRLAIAGPPDYDVQVRHFDPLILRREADGVSGVADADIPRAELLIVRPKGGAWQLAASEGAGGDADRRQDGKLALDFSAAVPLIDGFPAPKRLKNKDVVVLIDSARLEVFTTEINQ